jgi:anti-sigma factor RsiW
MEGERVVAGVRCGEVLAELSELLDGTLTPARARQLQEHVRGCDPCGRFGDELTGAVHALRTALREPQLESGARDRLRLRLKSEIPGFG